MTVRHFKLAQPWERLNSDQMVISWMYAQAMTIQQIINNEEEKKHKKWKLKLNYQPKL